MFNTYEQGARCTEMFHMHEKKSKKVMAAVLIIFLVLAMVIPTLTYFVM